MTTGSTTVQAPAQPLRIGPHVVTPPVVLAPMAGITNQPFRTLCREYGGGLYVSEMITTRALVERDPETMRLIEFGPQETPRSLQLYGVDPAVVREAVTMIVAEDRADHIDLNFGCPVPKVTRRGGGAALPWKSDLLRAVLRAAVRRGRPGARHDEDAQGHRRRPPDLPGRRPHRRGRGRHRDRAARPDRRAGLLRARRLVGGRPAQGARHLDPGARQR